MILSSAIVSKEPSTPQKKNLYYPWPTENQLWKDFKSGNKKAFSHIYKNYFNVLFNYGCKIINDENLVKDCIQDLFFELWESKKLSDTDSIKFYLLKSIRNKILKKLNQQNKHFDKNGLSFNYDFNLVLSYETELINEQCSVEQKEGLLNCIKKLSKRQQEAIHLRYFDDFNYDEISSIMSINHQSVHNLIYKAIKILRDNLIMVLILSITSPI